MLYDVSWVPANIRLMLKEYKRIEEIALKTKDDTKFELLAKQLQQIEHKIKLEYDFMETDELEIIKNSINSTFTKKHDLNFFRNLSIA